MVGNLPRANEMRSATRAAQDMERLEHQTVILVLPELIADDEKPVRQPMLALNFVRTLLKVLRAEDGAERQGPRLMAVQGIEATEVGGGCLAAQNDAARALHEAPQMAFAPGQTAMAK